MGFFEKCRHGLKRTHQGMMRQMGGLFKSSSLDEEFFEQLEEILVLADVGMNTATRISEKLRDKIKEEKVSDPKEAQKLLQEIITEMLSGDRQLHIDTKPSVIMVIGVNGVGKTTTIGKLASQLKADGKTVLLGAADTFRAAAVQQLQIWADRNECRMVRHEEGSDPASVVYDAVVSAKSRGTDVVICDTAGRLHNKKNLMDELQKMVRVMQKEAEGCDQEFLLVLDATTGQNGIMQAKEFQQAAPLTGIVLTKLDGTAKGGIVIAIKEELGLPIKYIGVGEQIDDLQPFDAELFVKALFEEE